VVTFLGSQLSLLWEVVYAALVHTLQRPQDTVVGTEQQSWAHGQFEQQMAVLDVYRHDVCEAARRIMVPKWIENLVVASITQTKNSDSSEHVRMNFLADCVRRVAEVPSKMESDGAGSSQTAEVAIFK
jgi:hypothetical protein